jgi:hypothetical protein
VRGLHHNLALKHAYRWVYKHFFVADGNFKADHVRQKENVDIWLSEGSGMFSKRADYLGFLESVTNHFTVRPPAELCRCQYTS